MSVQRYKFQSYNLQHTDAIVAAEDGDMVKHADYAALEARCAGLERDLACSVAESNMRKSLMVVMSEHRDALQAKLAAAEEALRLARERQGKRLEWIWDGLRAICAMDPSTEAERMQQWASDTLYGAATPTEWEPDVRALRMEEFKKRPPIAGHAPATKGEGDE